MITFSDYYPFGMLLPDRHSSSDKYRYGFNGMEKDDELKGLGNSYTTHFRQLDPRIGRWLSTDPVIKEYITPYNAFSNNPLMFIDPRGDDDYFDSKGNYLGSDNKRTSNIIVLRDMVPLVFFEKLYDLDGSSFSINPEKANNFNPTDLTSFNYEVVTNQNMLENVGNHYLNQMGLDNRNISAKKGKKIVDEEGKERRANMYTRPEGDKKNIFIPYYEGRISNHLNQFQNFKSILSHENGHIEFSEKNPEVGHQDDLEHLNRYINQLHHKTFDGITVGYLNNIKANILNYTKKILKEESHSVIEVQKKLDKINEYSFELGGMFMTIDDGTDASFVRESIQILEPLIITGN